MRDQLIPACKLLLFNEMGHSAYCTGSFFSLEKVGLNVLNVCMRWVKFNIFWFLGQNSANLDAIKTP